MDDLRDRIGGELEAARARTRTLLEPLPDDELRRQHTPLQSPLAWDLAHIGYFEELWLVRGLGDGAPADPRFDDLYDAFRHARAERDALPLLSPAEAWAYLDDVRARTLDVLARVDLEGGDRLLADGYVYGLVVQHEQQHCETMLQTLQARDSPYPAPAEPAASPASGERLVDGGPFVLGSDEPWAYDNERPAHAVELPPFRIAAAPVRNGEWLEFLAAGGYDDERLWSEEGRRHRLAGGLEHPLYWRRDGDGGWLRRRFGRLEPVPADEPVRHVCFHEAEAFARWAGRRLPTEAEWEKAARAGALEGVGGVWEWTSSQLGGYPGFEAFPYAEYSEAFFGPDHRVLRGASFATAPVVARTSFRNWDFPVRRQIFCGLRLAADA